MIKYLATIVGLLLGLIAGGANAALYSRAGGTMVYDDVLKITWLADWNYAATSGYASANAGGSGTNQIQSDGRMGWDAARTWSANLVVDGYGGWRLPSTYNGDETSGVSSGTCSASAPGCVDSEISYMVSRYWFPFPTTNTANLALFNNIQPFYWLDTEVGSNYAYYYSIQSKTLGIGPLKSFPFFAVAVHDGDIANVPVPATLALLGLGLVGIGAARRKQALSAAPGELA
jgi:hypothetical protein